MTNHCLGGENKGAVTVILVILVMSVLSVIGFGISKLMSSQVRMSGQASRSVLAFYAAESGAEQCLYRVRREGMGAGAVTGTVGSGSDQASFRAEYNGVGQIISIGQLRQIQRKIELNL